MLPHSSFLPTDEVIFERSKLWSNFLSRIASEEDYQELHYDEVTSHGEDDDESESEVNENDPANNCEAVVKANNFEGSSSSDEFDVEDLLNETIPVIEERKRKWKEAGMDRVLDTFDFNAITDKVGSWLKKSRMEKCMAPNSSIEDAQIMHFENHQIHFNSDDSLQSADTAKYILSNRKPRAASCTTMTIKRFRYVKRKQNELQSKYSYLNEYDVKQNLDEVFTKRCAGCRPTTESRVISRAKSEVNARDKFRNKTYNDRLNDSFPKVVAKRKNEIVQRQKSRYRKRRSDTSRKRSVSRSSSSSSFSNCSNSYAKPRFRRVNRKSAKCIEPRPCIDLTLITTSTGSELSPKETLLPVGIADRKVKLPMSPENLKEVKIAQSSNATCFLPENIVNSTALCNKKTDNTVKTKNCQLSPITRKETSKSKLLNKKSLNGVKDEKKSQDNEKLIKEQKSVQASSISGQQTSDRKVLVYAPGNKNAHDGIASNGCFKLTEDHLRKSIGEKAARRFIKFNAREFPWKFDSSSTVYFKLPTESDNSNRSGTSDDSADEDVLNMFGKQGKLVEQPPHKL